jgi:hypothetical protein
MIVNLLSTIPTNAQTKTSIGLTFGRGSSTFGGGALDYSKYTQNDRVGLSINIAPSRFFSIEPQINIEKKGARITQSNGSVGIRTSYIQTPLLFKLSIPIADVLYPNIFIGPYYASSIKQTRELVNNGSQEIAYTDIEIARFDYGTTLGIGAKLELNQLFLGVDARSDYGLKKIGDIRYDPKTKNISHSINATIGLIF